MVRYFKILPVVACLVVGWTSVSRAQFSPPAAPVDPAAVARGQQVYAQNCTFCHGPDARGGAEGGVDLTQSAIVMGDPTSAQLVAFLKVGRPPRMPAFNNLTDAQVADIEAFVRSKVPPAGRGGRGATVVAVVGEAKAGEVFFNGAGKCTTCHSVTGDLKGVGGKYSVLILQGRIVLPRGTGGYPGRAFGPPASGTPDASRTVTVTVSGGQVTTGDLVSISDFDVTLRDSSGALRTFARNGEVPKIEVKDPLQAHLDMMPKLSDKNMHDLTAYLVTLK